MIDGGAATGATGIAIRGEGQGDATTGDGILVVAAENGATTGTAAFGLTDRVAAGPFEYVLFKGGLTEGTGDAWYLRSAIVTPNEGDETLVPAPPIPGPDPLAQVPAPSGPQQPPTPGATPIEGDVVPLYRIEVATYAVIPPTARLITGATLGTFHERRGDQRLLAEPGVLPAAWVRGFGQHLDLQWQGDVEPGLDGDLFGLQVGQDLLGRADGGHSDRIGLFVGHAGLGGDVTGRAFGWNDVATGSVDTNGTSLGAYWTHVGPGGWYLDSVLMGTWLDGEATASTGERIDIEGSAFTASLEAGYPLAATARWTVEPQAQLVWTDVGLDDQRDGISTVDFDSDGTATGRLGARLTGDYPRGDRTLVPYLSLDLWHGFGGEDTVTFGQTPIVTDLAGSALGIGGGIVAELDAGMSLFATADYAADLGGPASRVLAGTIGIDIRF